MNYQRFLNVEHMIIVFAIKSVIYCNGFGVKKRDELISCDCN